MALQSYQAQQSQFSTSYVSCLSSRQSVKYFCQWQLLLLLYSCAWSSTCLTACLGQETPTYSMVLQSMLWSQGAHIGTPKHMPYACLFRWAAVPRRGCRSRRWSACCWTACAWRARWRSAACAHATAPVCEVKVVHMKQRAAEVMDSVRFARSLAVCSLRADATAPLCKGNAQPLKFCA